MCRWVFVSYFILMHSVGLLSVVLSNDRIAFLADRQLCYAQDPDPTVKRAAVADHHHGHSHGFVSEQRCQVKSPVVPFFHCPPIQALSLSISLFVPSELPEVFSLPHPGGLEWNGQPANVTNCVHNRSPLTPPPRASLS